MPADPLGETPQLTVALVRKPEEKHPKASAQRCWLSVAFGEKQGTCISEMSLVFGLASEEQLPFHSEPQQPEKTLLYKMGEGEHYE
ncbi:hypothetical protein Nmel_006211 [Mimus melanotis]